MAKGISLHIGLNFVDPNHYSGWDGELMACEADADCMQDIANKQGFETHKMLTKEATRANVIARFEAIAGELSEGDMFWISFSGHGGTVPDRQYEEIDGQDETWCLYDAQIIDDELWELYARFRQGVRILVVSDSCHSGTVARAPTSSTFSNRYQPNVPLSTTAPVSEHRPRYRFMPPDIAAETFRRNPDTYIPIVDGLPHEHEASPMAADIRLISGCQDNQFSLDGTFNGLFTSRLLYVWRDGQFPGDYGKFHKEIVKRMPPEQSPNHARWGSPVEGYDAQRPFTI